MKELFSFYKLPEVWSSNSKECVDRKRLSPPRSIGCFVVYKPLHSCPILARDFLKILLCSLASTWKFVLGTCIGLLAQFSRAQLPMPWGTPGGVAVAQAVRRGWV